MRHKSKVTKKTRQRPIQKRLVFCMGILGPVWFRVVFCPSLVSRLFPSMTRSPTRPKHLSEKLFPSKRVLRQFRKGPLKFMEVVTEQQIHCEKSLPKPLEFTHHVRFVLRPHLILNPNCDGYTDGYTILYPSTALLRYIDIYTFFWYRLLSVDIIYEGASKFYVGETGLWVTLS